MLRELLFALWFFLPAGLANVAPIIAAHLPWLSAFSFPLDCYLTWHGKRILGSHKTLRGLLSGILVGMLVSILQVWCYEWVPLVNILVPFDYSTIHPLLFGSLAGMGALLGDAMKSFFKRQLGINPGKSWFPFDQLDYIIGGLALISLYVPLPLSRVLLIALIWFILHPLATLLGYHLRLKESPM